jgi:hypothetical protein
MLLAIRRASSIVSTFAGVRLPLGVARVDVDERLASRILYVRSAVQGGLKRRISRVTA